MVIYREFWAYLAPRVRFLVCGANGNTHETVFADQFDRGLAGSGRVPKISPIPFWSVRRLRRSPLVPSYQALWFSPLRMHIYCANVGICVPCGFSNRAELAHAPTPVGSWRRGVAICFCNKRYCYKFGIIVIFKLFETMRATQIIVNTDREMVDR